MQKLPTDLQKQLNDENDEDVEVVSVDMDVDVDIVSVDEDVVSVDEDGPNFYGKFTDWLIKSQQTQEK